MENQTPGIDHTAPFEQRATAIINWAFGGMHHLRKEPVKKKLPWGEFWKLLIYENDLGSFDHSHLTKLVICAHHYAVRVSVTPAGKYLAVELHERDRGAEGQSRRHPELVDPIEWFKDWNEGKSSN